MNSSRIARLFLCRRTMLLIPVVIAAFIPHVTAGLFDSCGGAGGVTMEPALGFDARLWMDL